MARSRVGISPVIAVLIIVAVAIIISLAAASWLLGVWGSVATGNPELRIIPIEVDYDDDNDQIVAEFTVINEGTAPDTLIRADILLPNGTIATITPNQNIPVGTTTLTLTFTGITGDVEEGDKVVIDLIFERSGKYTITERLK